MTQCLASRVVGKGVKGMLVEKDRKRKRAVSPSGAPRFSSKQSTRPARYARLQGELGSFASTPAAACLAASHRAQLFRLTDCEQLAIVLLIVAAILQ